MTSTTRKCIFSAEYPIRWDPRNLSPDTIPPIERLVGSENQYTYQPVDAQTHMRYTLYRHNDNHSHISIDAVARKPTSSLSPSLSCEQSITIIVVLRISALVLVVLVVSLKVSLLRPLPPFLGVSRTQTLHSVSVRILLYTFDYACIAFILCIFSPPHFHVFPTNITLVLLL